MHTARASALVLTGAALALVALRYDRSAPTSETAEVEAQAVAAMQYQDPTARLAAVLAAAKAPDDPRDGEARPPVPLGERATPWRPFRAHIAIAAGPALVFTHDGADRQALLSVAREGRPDRRLVAAARPHYLIPLAVDDRFAYYDQRGDAGAQASSFRRVPLAGGRSEELGRDAGRATVAGDWLYWSHGDDAATRGVIHALHRRTGATVEVDASMAATVTSLAATRDRLYVLATDPPTRRLDLPPAHLLELALDPDGSPAADAVLTEIAVMRSDRPIELAAEGDTLYYLTEGATLANDGTLRRWDRAARTGHPLATGLASPMRLTATAGHLCFGLMRPGDVREVDCLRLADGRLLLVHSSPTEIIPYGPVQFGGRVLWTQEAAAGDETVAASLGAGAKVD